MILFFNYLWVLCILAGLFVGIKMKRNWPFVLGLVASFFAITLTPAYIPKGVVERTDVAAFEEVEREIEDRQGKPAMTPEERGKHINSRIDSVDEGVKQ